MINEAVISQIVEISKKNKNIHKIILFGSRARGDFKEKSDYDVAFILNEYNENDWIRFKIKIEDGVETLKTMDLVVFSNVSHDLRSKILLEGKVVYEREDQKFS